MQVNIVKQGEGPKVPRGTNVKVHYTGRLENGKVFDSSVERREPFTFRLGVGQVIKCWDEGIQKLNVGSEATLTCPPDYAYGRRGAGGAIPPNATLTFDVKVLGYQ
jgi:FKBP-type peptidyl-prolyl cis-trans isomerase